MNILVCGDVHGRPFWKEPINDIINGKVDIDEIVFIGDYFDPYFYEGISEYDTIINWFELLKTVKNNLSPTRYTFLIGNHDAQYSNEIFLKNAGGPRISYRNFETIKGIFEDNKKLFQIAYEINLDGKTILFTHAGVNKPWAERHKDILPSINAYSLNKLAETDEGWIALSDVGKTRGGHSETGGPLWADVNDNYLENEPYALDGIDFQIFGHTQQEKYPIITSKFAMLDCRKPFVLNDNCEIIEYNDFMKK